MLIIVGPSASGKTEVVKMIIKKYNMKKLVTYTTRNMRVGEVDGIDYHFISHESFLKKVKEQFFVETVYYNQFYYGTSYSDLTNDKIVILEPTGLKHYLQLNDKHIRVCFLDCPKKVRQARMIKRGDNLDVINCRLSRDDEIFNQDVAKLAHWVINSSDITIDKLADDIYTLYRNSLKE